MLDLKVIHSFLSQSYWSKGIPLEVVKTQIENSFCVGVYFKTKLIGFARVVTDYSSHAYLCDVFISEKFQRKGLSKSLMEFVINHPKLENLRTWRLATKDAHSLYSKFGFTSQEFPERMMERKIKTW